LVSGFLGDPRWDFYLTRTVLFWKGKNELPEAMEERVKVNVVEGREGPVDPFIVLLFVPIFHNPTRSY
jgi:hypothetical protein